MKFQYYKIPTTDPKRKWISRPIVPVILYGPKGIVPIDALIDSGADRSLFHIEVGRRLGLDLNKAPVEVFTGIEGGKLFSKIHKVKLQIIGIDEAVEIIAGFVDGPGVTAILGQEGFFDAFRIKFEKDHNVIEINPATKR